jgi:hypothetical protein
MSWEIIKLESNTRLKKFINQFTLRFNLFFEESKEHFYTSIIEIEFFLQVRNRFFVQYLKHNNFEIGNRKLKGFDCHFQTCFMNWLRQRWNPNPWIFYILLLMIFLVKSECIFYEKPFLNL